MSLNQLFDVPSSTTVATLPAPNTGFAAHFVRPNQPSAGFAKPEDVRRHFAINTEKIKKDLKSDISFDSKRKSLLQYKEV